jgi:hypothetical protein
MHMHMHMHMQVTFAIKHGYWQGGATDPAFSFSGAYDPVTFEGARFCEVLPPLATRCTPVARCNPLSALHRLACTLRPLLSLYTPQARVWAIFSALADPADFDAPRYLDYVQVSSESVDR